MTRLILLFFILTFFMSCDSGRASEDVLPEDKMIDVLTDIQILESFIVTMTPDSVSKNKLNFYKSVFEKHRTDSAQFRKSMDFYAKDPLNMAAMYEKVGVNIDTIQARVILRKALKNKR